VLPDNVPFSPNMLFAFHSLFRNSARPAALLHSFVTVTNQCDILSLQIIDFSSHEKGGTPNTNPVRKIAAHAEHTGQRGNT